MSYEGFAYVYDFLMKDVPYEKWMQFLREKKEAYRIKENHVLDLGCGTGELSVRLSKEGFEVTGVDLSEDMLMVAQEKAMEERVRLSLFQQDMSELEGLGTFDIITIFCDSINYLPSPTEVKKTFEKVHNHLKEGGLFLFDTHSLYKVKEIFMNQTYAENEDEVSYIWTSYPGDEPDSVDHELTFFVNNENGLYERLDEWHTQRTYPMNQYTSWLEEIGFTVKEVTADFTNEAPNETSERIFFTCVKA
ncbi:class I SAM-dependent DNA methyltransferase [Heyndrickxia acidicola]|uniref:Class I SAM-dependent methyltransferase n=1 Tax=Heyndrickxia acidicola TaxID=209389 RepID=A0ABU6ML84_9BACI|nr:class I SAM-dependent methyltransferase [Heyndrickxia acidicola]MED1205064.1 class I SAM-dependent methyltransferase [Heyndrickxia acidicola]